MKIFSVIALVCLGVVQCQPTATGECTKEHVEGMQKCTDKVEASPEVQSLKAELEKAVTSCIPGYPSNCIAKAAAAETCWKQVQLESASNASLSAEARRKALVAMDECLGEDLWRVLENKFRHLNITDMLSELTAGMGMFGATGEAGAPPTKAVMDANMDACIPDMQKIGCLVKELLKNMNVLQSALKAFGLLMECSEKTPEPCRYKANGGQVDCHASDMAPLVEQYKTKVHDCVKTKGF